MLPGLDEDALEPADRDILYNWGLGIVVAALVGWYGWQCIRTPSGMFILGGRSSHMHVEGARAVSIGVFYCASACFLHFKFFWSCRERFLGYAQIGIVASLIAMAIGMISFIYYWLR